MEELQRSIPASINYQDVLPVSVPAVARRKQFYPNNGTTFNAAGTNEIRIELSSVNALLDPVHSYLELFIFNNDPAATVGFDLGGGDILFSEVRVEQSGRILAREQEHNRLHAGVLSAAQNTYQGQYSESIHGLQRGGNSGAGGGIQQMNPNLGPGVEATPFANLIHNTNVQAAVGQGMRVTLPMSTGLFTQDKLIPLPLVAQNQPITLVLIMDNSINCGSWSAAPATAGSLNITRISYVAQMIEVGGDVISQIRMMQEMGGGQLTISSSDIEHSQGTVPALSSGEQVVNLPIRKRSIKSLLFQINSQDFSRGALPLDASAFYNKSYGGSMNMNSYQLKVGSVVYPPQPVACWGDTFRAAINTRPTLPDQERGECMMELTKALGSLGFVNPSGRMAGVTYGVATAPARALGFPPLTDGDNGDGLFAPANLATVSGNVQSICPFGLDLDAFQHTAIEAGVDTETMALNTQLVFDIPPLVGGGGGGASGAESKEVHTWMIYDSHYLFNRDGTVSISD